MADMYTKEKRSAIMKLVGSKWTRPERVVYDGLKDLGLNPSVHEDNLPGKPDFVFMRQKLAVLVEGCFWHKCSTCYKPPKTNKQYWLPKIAANVLRDKRNRRKLRLQGFGLIRVWECSTRKRSIEATLTMIAEIVKSGGANAPEAKKEEAAV